MKHFRKLPIPYFIWEIIMIVLPLILIILYAITERGNSLLNIKFTADNLKKLFEPIYLEVLKKSFILGGISVGITFLIGYPLAYAITRFSDKTQDTLILLVTIPMWINTLLRTYAWISILADNGILNNFLTSIGLPEAHLMYTEAAVIIGLVSDMLPFMVIPIHTSIRKISPSLIEAAHDLGANSFHTFWRVIFRMSVPGIINGIMITFLMSISTFVIPKLLGGGQFVLIGNLIESQFISVGNWNFGAAISIILTVIIMAGLIIMRRFDRSSNK